MDSLTSVASYFDDSRDRSSARGVNSVFRSAINVAYPEWTTINLLQSKCGVYTAIKLVKYRLDGYETDDNMPQRHDPIGVHTWPHSAGFDLRLLSKECIEAIDYWCLKQNKFNHPLMLKLSSNYEASKAIIGDVGTTLMNCNHKYNLVREGMYILTSEQLVEMIKRYPIASVSRNSFEMTAEALHGLADLILTGETDLSRIDLYVEPVRISVLRDGILSVLLSLIHSRSISVLNLSFLQLDVEMMTAVHNALTSPNNMIKYLNLEGIRLNQICTDILKDALVHPNNKVRNLFLDSLQGVFNPSSLELILNAMTTHNSKLRQVNLFVPRIQFTDVLVQKLIENISSSKISHFKAYDATGGLIDILSEVLKNHRSMISHIEINQFTLDDHVIELLNVLLNRKRPLKSFTLRKSLSSKTSAYVGKLARRIAKLIKRGHLEHLDISSIGINSYDLGHIIEAISTETNRLKRLNLAGNKNIDVKELMKAVISKHSKISHLSIDGVLMKSTDVEAIMDALKSPHYRLLTLECGGFFNTLDQENFDDRMRLVNRINYEFLQLDADEVSEQSILEAFEFQYGVQMTGKSVSMFPSN